MFCLKKHMLNELNLSKINSALLGEPQTRMASFCSVPNTMSRVIELVYNRETKKYSASCIFLINMEISSTHKMIAKVGGAVCWTLLFFTVFSTRQDIHLSIVGGK